MLTICEQHRQPGQPEPDFDSDGLVSVTTALAGYLEEVDEACRTCLQHERTTVVSHAGGALRLTRFFPRSRATVAYIRRAAGGLPDWRQSPFRGAVRKGWERIREETVASPTTGPGGRLLLVRGISWEGRPVLVRVSAVGADRRLEVELHLPHVSPDLWELPLRTAAHGLLCHALLLPARVASPLPIAPVLPNGFCTLRQFLTRTAPQNLYSSQCFSDPGAAY